MEFIKTRLSEELQFYILSDYEDGATQAAIAHNYDIPMRQVRNVLYNSGLCAHPDKGGFIDAKLEIELDGPNDESETLSSPNILIIPDLHAPFIKDGYLEFCKQIKEKWSVPDDSVYQAGDLIDNHFSSFHDTDPDGYGASEELTRAIEQLRSFHVAFPLMKISIGNHDTIPARKAFNAGLSTRWIKSIEDVLGFDGWLFDYSWDLGNNITLCHGTARQATRRAAQDNTNIIQAHYHSKSYIKTIEDTPGRIWAMQLGAGMDDESYAAAYGKHSTKTKMNVGILLFGKYPIIEWLDEY